MNRLFWILSLTSFVYGYDLHEIVPHLSGWDRRETCDMACDNAYYLCSLLNHHIDLVAASKEDLSHFSPHFLDLTGKLNKNCWSSYLACAHDCRNYGLSAEKKGFGERSEDL